MKKINLQPYEIIGPNNEGEQVKIPFNVKDSLVNILFSDKLGLNPARLLEQNKLAEKITEAGDEILLEQEEYDRVKKALDVTEGLTQFHVEFVKRIYEAEDVDVEEKNPHK